MKITKERGCVLRVCLYLFVVRETTIHHSSEKTAGNQRFDMQLIECNIFCHNLHTL